MENENEHEDNIGYSSTLTVTFSSNPQHKAEYLIGPFKTPQQLQLHCKFLLNFLYQKYPETTSLITMIEAIDEQENSEAGDEYDVSQNVLYLIPWISLVNRKPIKQALLQQQHTNIIAKITNNHELVFFMRQEIDQHNKLETGLICPTDSKIYVMHGFVEVLSTLGLHINSTNLAITDPNIDMVYIDELLCPKNNSIQTTYTNDSFYKVPLSTPEQATQSLPIDSYDTLPLESRPISPLVFRSMHRNDVTTASEFRRAPTSAMRQ